MDGFPEDCPNRDAISFAQTQQCFLILVWSWQRVPLCLWWCGDLQISLQLCILYLSIDRRDKTKYKKKYHEANTKISWDGQSTTDSKFLSWETAVSPAVCQWSQWVSVVFCICRLTQRTKPNAKSITQNANTEISQVGESTVWLRESLSQLENSSELSCSSVSEWVLHKSTVELTSWALQAEPTLQGRSLLSDSVLQTFNQILVRGRDGNNPS